MTPVNLVFNGQELDDLESVVLTRALSNGDAMSLRVSKRKTIENDIVSAPPPRQVSVRIGDDSFGDFTLHKLADSKPFTDVYYTWDLRRLNDIDAARRTLLAQAPSLSFGISQRAANAQLSDFGGIETALTETLDFSARALKTDLFKTLSRYLVSANHPFGGGLRILSIENPPGVSVELLEMSYVADSLVYSYSENNFPGDHGRRIVRARYQSKDDTEEQYVMQGTIPPAHNISDRFRSELQALAAVTLARGRLRDTAIGFSVSLAEAPIALTRFLPGMPVTLDGRRAIVHKVVQSLTEFNMEGAQRHDCLISGFLLNPGTSVVR